MLTIKVKKGWFRSVSLVIPSGWSDLTFRQFIQLLECDDEVKAVEILTGQNIPIPESMHPYFDFFREKYDLEEIQPLDYLPFGGEIFVVPNIFGESFGKKIRLKMHLESKFEISKIHEVVGVYLPLTTDQLYACNFFDLYGVYLNIVNQYKSIIENENRALSFNPDHIQVMAGIKNFAEFGDFNTVDMIAKEYNYTHEQVENLEYSTIFLILRKKAVEDAFQKSYATLKRTMKE